MQESTIYVWHLSVIAVEGSFLDMPMQALILGTIAGAFVQGRGAVTTRLQGISAVLISALISGAFTPSTVILIQHELGIPINDAALFPAVSVFYGGTWVWLLPKLAEFGEGVLIAFKDFIIRKFRR